MTSKVKKSEARFRTIERYLIHYSSLSYEMHEFKSAHQSGHILAGLAVPRAFELVHVVEEINK